MPPTIARLPWGPRPCMRGHHRSLAPSQAYLPGPLLEVVTMASVVWSVFTLHFVRALRSRPFGCPAGLNFC